jgi:hypothetical protein
MLVANGHRNDGNGFERTSDVNVLIISLSKLE